MFHVRSTISISQQSSLVEEQIVVDRAPTTLSIDINGDIQESSGPVLDSCHYTPNHFYESSDSTLHDPDYLSRNQDLSTEIAIMSGPEIEPLTPIPPQTKEEGLSCTFIFIAFSPIASPRYHHSLGSSLPHR